MTQASHVISLKTLRAFSYTKIAQGRKRVFLFTFGFPSLRIFLLGVLRLHVQLEDLIGVGGTLGFLHSPGAARFIKITTQYHETCN